MSNQQLQKFQQRSMTAESTIKSLQEQLVALRQQMENHTSNSNDGNNALQLDALTSANDCKSGKSNTYQPDKTYPVWYTPYNQLQALQPDNIVVINSLCPKEKVPFIPKNGRLIKWYTCGPTVYAPSHMGHARTYITFDIIRNILEYYFSYRVNLVMNITDVDDKIILRARQNYLFEQYTQQNIQNSEKITQDVDTAFQQSLEKRTKAVAEAELKLKNADKRHANDMQENLDGERVKLKNVEGECHQYKQALAAHKSGQELLQMAKSALSEMLDREQGHTVTDQKIFRAHAQAFEQEFFEDMRRLNVRDPDVLTRVTEYVPEIIAFVQKLIGNGYAYESNGSVYFSIERYLQHHDYPKLDPKKLDNQQLMDDAEGALASKDAHTEKRSERDFALWKKSRNGEPQWPSPWGLGRPGWHIECSTMAAQVLGDNMDIHTGGEDLKFPHHDNEMAQSCAYFSDPTCAHFHQQWVNYWFHAGHLHIGGLKMSKSLKNFISIREALEMCSTRQIRLLFLLQSWHGKMNYSDDSITETKAKEHGLTEFFLLVNALNRKYNSEACVSSTPYLPSNAMDAELNRKIMTRQLAVDKALRDNFDYVTATQQLFDLISDVNTYLKTIGDSELPNILLLNKTASFVNDMLKIFGVVEQNETYFLGAKQMENEQTLQPVLDVITSYRAALTLKFRHKVAWKEYQQVVQTYQTQIAKLEAQDDEKTATEIALKRGNVLQMLRTFNANMLQLTASDVDASKKLIAMTDELRDVSLPKYGIKIEDVEGGKGSMWKYYENGEDLMQTLNSAQSAKNEKDREKIENKTNQLQRDIDTWKHKSVSPLEVFQLMTDDNGIAKYAQFDDKGFPTHTVDSKPLSNKQKKKLNKTMEAQTKKYESYQEKLKENANFLQDLETELNKYKAML